MSVKIRLEDLKAEEIVQYIYLDKEIPKDFNSDTRKILQFLRKHVKDVNCIEYILKKLVYIHLSLDAFELCPSDLTLIDKFRV